MIVGADAVDEGEEGDVCQMITHLRKKMNAYLTPNMTIKSGRL